MCCLLGGDKRAGGRAKAVARTKANLRRMMSKKLALKLRPDLRFQLDEGRSTG